MTGHSDEQLRAVQAVVDAHIRDNRIAVRPGRRCIDGRYAPQSVDSGRLARPGGDFGFVQVMLSVNRALGLGWSTLKCLSEVYDALVAIDGTFYMHTDSENCQRSSGFDAGLPGCRHIAFSTSNPLVFNLNADDVIRAYDLVTQHSPFRQRVYMAVVEGPNRESAVLVNLDPESSFEPRDASGNTFFLYDRSRDEDLMADLFTRLNLPPTSRPLFQRTAREQVLYTLSLLGTRLPVFMVGDKAEMITGDALRRYAEGRP